MTQLREAAGLSVNEAAALGLGADGGPVARSTVETPERRRGLVLVPLRSHVERHARRLASSLVPLRLAQGDGVSDEQIAALKVASDAATRCARNGGCP